MKEKGNLAYSNGKVKFREYFAFSFGVFGQNMIGGFVVAYIMIFYTDYLGIASTAAGTLFFVARLWDAINDPMMGFLTEQTRTRWGKFRPYFLYAPIPLLIIIVLLFSTPSFNIGNLMWAYVTYIAYGMIYTIMDIPMWSMTSVMSTNQIERNRLITCGKTAAPLGIVLVSLVTVPLIKIFGGGASGYRMTALLYGVIAFVGFMGLFLFTKERMTYSEKKVTLKDSINLIIKNTPLLKILSAQVLIIIVNSIIMATVMYYCIYVLGSDGYVPILSASFVFPMIVGFIIALKLGNRLGKKRALIIFIVLRFIGFILLYFVGYENIYIFIGINAIVSITFGAPEVLLPSMMVETIDYMELKTGIRAEGVIWSTQTFIAKTGGALAGILLGILLKFIEYVPNEVQTVSTINGLHGILTLVPAAALLLALVPVMVYKLDEKKHREILRALGRGNKNG
ncbi:MFS transporter [Oceanirhabdus sp. W0125-5]|uniref:MFS transporter n=1 Tax=Oceanirhabdus sp. W0125-5 TaxID=2999116 RepID=UPI0022F2B121|nr:glycoside-pentoside-hexuronide (GPH):cation symporter [Oceanirhabdus sp. W0125-5]WBW96820.1 glycoside-pentoside-hexuronide (GPH):cation symporter [Oceanirhabdus sp. W0125-5]